MTNAPRAQPTRHEADELLANWESRARLSAIAQARSANRCVAWDARLGSTATVLTAIVGTSIFATLQEDVSVAARVVVGVLTIAAATSTAVHTFAALSQRRDAYQKASRRHAAVRRRIEAVRARLAEGEQFDVWAEIASLQTALDDAALASPNASPRIWERTRRQLNGHYTWWERLGLWARGLPSASVIRPHHLAAPRPIARPSNEAASDPEASP
jgi:hypothetical protein